MSNAVDTKPIVHLTESAVAQVKRLLAQEPDNAGKGLRLYVEKGGCSGMQYGMVFDEAREADQTAEFEGVPVRIDPFSAEYIRGAVVDFVDELNGGGFKIANPNARESCGCGRSFHS